jgi:3-oxoacyl-[acyl-carrier-protein] synthase-3
LAKGTFKNIKIKGITSAVPERCIAAHSYCEHFGLDVVNKFMMSTGIKERHVAEDNQTASDLCYVAANDLLYKLGWDPQSIDVLIFVTQTADYRVPSTACILQKRLGILENCISFDVNLGCSGFVYGIFTASSFLQNSFLDRALLLIGDTASYICDEDKSTAMMFGDAGSAIALEKIAYDEIIRFLLKTDGNRYNSLIVPCGGARNPIGDPIPKFREDGCKRSDYHSFMDGTEVFNFSITDVPRTIKEFNSIFNKTIDEYDYCILHQANLFMLNYIAKKIKLPLEKLPISLDRYGNTNGSSIPITLCDLCNKTAVKDRISILASGFGVGLSWGVLSFEIESSVCFPIITTADYFKEAFHV